MLAEAIWRRRWAYSAQALLSNEEYHASFKRGIAMGVSLDNGMQLEFSSD